MIIAFSGIDGSGKTTYARYAVDYLDTIKSKNRYMHITRDSFYHFILHNVIGRVSKSSKESLESGLRNRENKIYFLITKSIKKLLLLINLIYFNLRYSWYRGNVNNNIVCDRYFYDDVVQMIYLGLAGRGYLNFYKSLIPRPDLAFFLKVNPEIARARKDEYDNGYFTEKSKMYSDIYSSLTKLQVSDGKIEDNKNLIRTQIKALLGVK